MHAKPSRWLHEISISKTVCHHFGPGRIPHYNLGVLMVTFHINNGNNTGPCTQYGQLWLVDIKALTKFAMM